MNMTRRMDGPSVSLGSKLSNAKVSFAIFKRDIKRLIVNPVALVVTIGVCIIPSLYAWYNIVANWDPYGNTQGIKIAIANGDAGTQNKLVGKLNAGDQVVDQLKDNDQLGWTFVDSAADAKEGVESGEYYAAIVIPKNFSQNLLSMLDGKFHQPKLTYYVNEKKSAIAPKVTDTGANTIEETLNSTFVSTVSETVAKIAKKAGVDLKDKTSNASSSLSNSVKDAEDTLQDVRVTLQYMDNAIDSTSGSISSADAALAGLGDQMPSLTKAIDQGNDLLGETRTTAGKLGTSLSSSLSSGSALLSKTSTSANKVVGGLAGTLQSGKASIDGSLAQLQGVIDSNQNVIDRLKYDQGFGNSGNADVDRVCNQVIDSLQTQNSKLQSVHDALQAQSDAVGKDAETVAAATDSVDGAIQNGVNTIDDAQKSIDANVMPKVSSGLDSFSAVAGDLKGAVSGLTPTISNARGLLKQLDSTLSQTKTVLKQTDTSLTKIQEKLDKAANDIAALQTSESLGELADLMGVNVKDVAEFMASPVELKSKAVYPVASFGSGIAPFYTNLALWVGGYVLIAIYKLEVDREGIGDFTARQAYFGRWLLMVLLGAFQAIIVTVGDLVIGVQCLHPFLFVLGGVCISFVYVNIIYALSMAFKHIGKAIGVILVIVQIPGSSGMYPIEMMPGFFQWLHPLLPFTYGINLLRETIGGLYSFNYVFNLAVLAIFLAIALFIGVVLRPGFLNLNLLFDKQLATTGLMICESNDMPSQRYSLRTAMRIMLDSESYRRELIDHAVRFERRYPRYIKGGFTAVIGVQIVLFVLSSVLDIDNNGKIILLVIWILSVIAICSWLIWIEYIRSSLATQLRISSLSDEDLRREMREHTVALPGTRRRMSLNSKERGDGADRPTTRLSSLAKHLGAHGKGQTGPLGNRGADDRGPTNGDDATTFLGNHAAPRNDDAPRGKHSKGGEA